MWNIIAYPAIIAAIAAIIVAAIGWASIKSVVISNHRQAWINALRDDLAEFFTSVDEFHFAHSKLLQRGAETDLTEQRDLRNKVLLTYRRTLMRLNIREPLHQRLEGALQPLLDVSGKTINQTDLATAVLAAREVLKYEWEVTKWGMFARPIRILKASIKWLFGFF